MAKKSKELIAALKEELLGYKRAGKKDRAKAVEAELNQYKRERTPEKKSIYIAISGENKGTLTLMARYQIPGANWTPTYDVRVNHKNSKISLDYFGTVKQRTGEDLNNVTLSLSTAQPQISGHLPQLSPWYIDFYQPGVREGRKMLYSRAKKAAPSKKEDQLMLDEEAAMPEPLLERIIPFS